jgi:hypothetical protein
MLAGMTDDDDLDFDAILKNLRPVNGYWAYGDKRVGEPNTASEILKSAGFLVERLVARPDGQDPPDCEGAVDHSHAGIEVTELVHRKRLQRSLAGRFTRFTWDGPDFAAALQNIIDKKGGDGPRWQGGPYGQRLLVVHTDEPDLNSNIVSRFLDGRRFATAFFQTWCWACPTSRRRKRVRRFACPSTGRTIRPTPILRKARPRGEGIREGTIKRGREKRHFTGLYR